MDNEQKYNVVVTRTLNAPVGEVWKAWSDPTYVKQWWGPKGFTCPLAEMDFREGGTSLVCMRAPQEYGGQDMYNTWTYQSIDPRKRIEFVNHFTDKDGMKLNPAQIGMPPGIPEGVRHVVTFTELDGARTEMTVTEYDYTVEQTRDLSKAGMEECIDKMAMIFARP